jgi:hypothetical protein
VSFAAGGSNEMLKIGKVAGFAATIGGFARTDFIDLFGVAGTAASFSGHTLTVTGTAGSVAHLSFAGTYASNAFAVTTDHHGGINISLA